MKLTVLSLFLMLSLFFVSAYDQKQEEDPTSMVDDLQDYDEEVDTPYDEEYDEEKVDAADRSAEQKERDLGYGYDSGYSSGYRSYGGSYSSGYSYGRHYPTRPTYVYTQPRVVNRYYYSSYGGSKGMGKGRKQK
jgi:hypothetical protein